MNSSEKDWLTGPTMDCASLSWAKCSWGRLVRDLKQGAGQQAVDQYIAEGYALGEAISAGELADNNAANNRQTAVNVSKPPVENSKGFPTP